MTLYEFLLALVAALLAAIPPSLVAYSALQQSKKNAEKTAENTIITQATSKKVDETATQVVEIGKQTTDVHTATNGASLKMETKFDEATKQIGELRAIIKSLVERETAAAPVRVANVKQTGELLEKVENGNTVSYTNLLKEVAELKEIMAGFAEKGMPVVAPAGESLPVKVVEVVSKK